MTPRKNAEKPARTPPRPATLSHDAAREWRRLAPEAARLGTLTPATARAFALLAELLANESAAAAIVAAEGITVRSAAGTSKPNPAMRTLEIARSQALPLLRQFGLLPAGEKAAAAAKQPSPNGKSTWAGVL